MIFVPGRMSLKRFPLLGTVPLLYPASRGLVCVRKKGGTSNVRNASNGEFVDPSRLVFVALALLLLLRSSLLSLLLLLEPKNGGTLLFLRALLLLLLLFALLLSSLLLLLLFLPFLRGKGGIDSPHCSLNSLCKNSMKPRSLRRGLPEKIAESIPPRIAGILRRDVGRWIVLRLPLDPVDELLVDRVAQAAFGSFVVIRIIDAALDLTIDSRVVSILPLEPALFVERVVAGGASAPVLGGERL